VSQPGNHVAVIHGVNLDQLGNRDPALYGTLTLEQLERRIEQEARELGLATSFFHSNHEGELIEHLHSLRGQADAILLNPGAWTHYAWAIRDALEIAALPAVEVHLSDVQSREPWRRVSVISELCLATISGRGPDGYKDALALLRDELQGGDTA
jgi:3-dehydroquinate dehydratase II